jgi:hypothetical protein
MVEIIGIIVLLIVIAVYVVFFVGMGKIFNMDEFREDSLLRNYLIAFTVLFVINILIMIFAPQWMFLHTLIFIVNLILLYFIYFTVNKTELGNYFLPLLVVLSIIFVIGVIMAIYYWANPAKLEEMKSTYESKMNLFSKKDDEL